MTGRSVESRPAPDLLAIRAAKIAIVAVVAAFFTLVSYTNIVDYNTNYEFVRHVLSMDTTFKSPHLMGRAIVDPALHTAVYWAIIGWEGATALSCWLGAARLGTAWSRPSEHFDRTRAVAVVGLLMGFLLYGFGFLVVASEWFAMWQSTEWNTTATAGMFATILLAALVFVGIPEMPRAYRAGA